MTPDPAGPGPAISAADLDRLTAAAFLVATGVMLAALAAALLWPAPETMSGAHASILDSHLQQIRLEPREKGFLALATAAGFVLALAALALRRPRIACNSGTLVLLALAAAVVNLCCEPALNDAAGPWWALAGLGAMLALTGAAVRLSR